MMKPCNSVDIENRADLVARPRITKVNGVVRYTPVVEHAGTIAHRCKLPDHKPHETLCECECGRTWLRNF